MDAWDHIDSPNNLRGSPPPTPTSQLTAAGTAIRDDYLRTSDSSAVFPPADQEGLELVHPTSHLIPLPPNSPQSSSSSSYGPPLPGNVQDSASSPEAGTGRGSGIRGVVLRAWDRLCLGVTVWKLMSTAGVLGVVAAAAYVSVKMLMRRRRPQRTAAVRQENRNRLILLIKEKDQRINQLLLQLAQMNEMILARRQVPVIRVG